MPRVIMRAAAGAAGARCAAGPAAAGAGRAKYHTPRTARRRTPPAAARSIGRREAGVDAGSDTSGREGRGTAAAVGRSGGRGSPPVESGIGAPFWGKRAGSGGAAGDARAIGAGAGVGTAVGTDGRGAAAMGAGTGREEPAAATAGLARKPGSVFPRFI